MIRTALRGALGAMAIGISARKSTEIAIFEDFRRLQGGPGADVTIDNDRAQNVTTWRTCRIQGMIYRYSSSLPSVDAAKLSGDMHLLPAGSKTVGRYALACHSRIQGKGTGNEEDKQRKGKGKVRNSQGIIRKNAQRK